MTENIIIIYGMSSDKSAYKKTRVKTRIYKTKQGSIMKMTRCLSSRLQQNN